MEQLKVGYLPLVKGSWVNGKQEIRRAEVIGMFSKLDAEIVEEGRIIVTEEEANSSIAKFEQERVDAVIVHFLSFALGAVVPAAARRLGVPVIFWSEPEPPWDGGRIQKNSFCGTNCNAHALWKMRLPYTFVYGEGPEAVEAIGRKLRVVAAVKGLRNLRIGSVGGRVPGFYASNYDELQLLDTFGISTEKLTMLEVVEKARKIFADSAEPCAPVADPIRSFDISDEERRRLKALFQAFVETAEKYRLDSEIREKSKDIENTAATLESFKAQSIQLEASVAQLKSEVDAIEIEVELPIPSEEEIRRTIRAQESAIAKLGNVNLRSIEEYDEKKARLDGLNAEVESLNRHIKELDDLMSSLTSKKKGLFMQSYNAVNENFKSIYAQLSGGGEAYMGLENEDDPFIGGLMINAKPRNGKMLRLEALSGGEKSLTALSFIFAIQEHQPSPFYVLDEVDMFLDSINAEMVARRVKESSAKAQFIQVSLRKVTLALADHLIGVTRPPSGISRVIMQPDLAEVSRYEEEALKRQKEAI